MTIRHAAVALLTVLTVTPAGSAAFGADRARVVTSPQPLPAAHDSPRIFLGGSIDMGSAPIGSAT